MSIEDWQESDRPLGTGALPSLGLGEEEAREVDLPEKFEDYREIVVTPGVAWVPILKRISINIFIPFINGIMLGFGEIIAHEVGLVLGWRTANVVDPLRRPASTNPRHRKKWLFGIM